MKYEVIGESVRIPYEKYDKHICDFIATYRPYPDDSKKYELEIKLEKIVTESGGEYKFEHIIDKQLITTNKYYVLKDVVRLISYGVKHGQFDDHLKEFKDEIKSSLYICAE